MVSVEIEATRRVETQLIVVREPKGLIRSWWTSLSGVACAKVIGFSHIQLSNTEDDRLMATSLLIVEKEGVQTSTAQI